MKEWNIIFAKHDGYGGKEEFFIIFPAWWKVLWWFLRHARSCCEINIWTSGRTEDNKNGYSEADTEFGI